jgi:hypothetical protein
MRRFYKQAMVTVLLVALAGCTTESQTAAQSKVRYTKEKRGAAALSGGAGYHGAYLVPNATKAASEPKKKAPKAAPGKLPLPVDYPLSPEDEKMWNKLTLEQQKRALLFLQDGSTIAASLKTE